MNVKNEYVKPEGGYHECCLRWLLPYFQYTGRMKEEVQNQICMLVPTNFTDHGRVSLNSQSKPRAPAHSLARFGLLSFYFFKDPFMFFFILEG